MVIAEIVIFAKNSYKLSILASNLDQKAYNLFHIFHMTCHNVLAE